MASISARDLRSRVSDVLDRAQHRGERIRVTRNGKPAGAIIPPEDLELLEWLEDHADLEAMREAVAEGGEPIPLEAIKAKLGL